MDLGALGRAKGGYAAPSTTDSAPPSVRDHPLKGVDSGRESGLCAAEDQDESLVAEPFKWTVAKCRAAHSVAVEVVGLCNNQSTRANGGKRSPPASQEQVPNTFEQLRQVLHMSFPRG
jgi:hypothetical protein